MRQDYKFYLPETLEGAIKFLQLLKENLREAGYADSDIKIEGAKEQQVEISSEGIYPEDEEKGFYFIVEKTINQYDIAIMS